jgi:predicted lysophospholipase L1 biosynthesis ABC-type transport system permease subunit
VTPPLDRARELSARRRTRELDRDARPRRLRLAGAVALGLLLGLLLGAGLEAWAVYAGIVALPVAGGQP